VNLQPCDGSSGQAWQVVAQGGGGNYALQPQINTSLCLGVKGNSSAEGAPVAVATCDGRSDESWAIQ
jgi:hypothetical protein